MPRTGRPKAENPPETPQAARGRAYRERKARGLVVVSVEVPAGTEGRIERAAEALRWAHERKR